MSILSRDTIHAAARPVLRWVGGTLMNVRFIAGRARMVFIVGHMRSGSTLLVHLLVNHPAVIGFGETKRKYSKPSDFGPTAYRVYRSFGRVWPRERYVVDKVLHDEFGLDPGLLDRDSVRTIFLLREPGQALPSILGRTKNTGTPEEATAYYVGRLNGIRGMVGSIAPDRWSFLTYRQLVAETDETLARLETFLELVEPLSPTYEPIWATGLKGIGDDSKQIGRGEIVRRRKWDEKKLDGFSPAMVRRATDAFESAVEAVARRRQR